jgi:hypothetical protein
VKRSAVSLVLAVSVLGCGPEGAFPPEMDPDAWIEARPPCTLSHDHDLTYIRVWADPAAHPIYTTFDGAYPAGATLLKGMYRDEECEELVGFVTMVKLEPGSAPEDMDWDWRRYDETGHEMVNPRRIPSTCVDCHVWHCGEQPYGWDLTCSQEGVEPPGPPPGS